MESRYLPGQDNTQPILAVTVILYSLPLTFMHVCCIYGGHIRTAGSDLLESKKKKASCDPALVLFYMLRLEKK